MARLGPPDSGLRRQEGEPRRRGRAPRADRPQLRRGDHRRDGRQAGRAGEAAGHRLRRRRRPEAAVPSSRTGCTSIGGLQRRAGSDHAERLRVQRDLDHRPRHDDGRGRRPRGRQVRQGRRPPLPLGQPARLPRRHGQGSEALRPAQRPLDPQGAARRGARPRLQQRLQPAGGAYSSVDEIVLPVDDKGQYDYAAGKPFGPDKAGLELLGAEED